MECWKWIAIEIAGVILGVATYYFYPNPVIYNIFLVMVIISAIMSIRKAFAEDSGVEING